MTTLVCKMCGGSIELTGESHGRCDSCGCEVTLPKIDDSKRADMYNRGNHFRTIGDFDKAYSAYEHIIADDQSDAEAHWCLMLCRYGVEYVKDVRTGDYKPTVSRMSFDPVLEDPDYLAALAASDEYTKEIYRREARKIESIQKQYLEISRKEAPYDVFICFKAEEPTGGRTRASEIGQDIYERLTEKGVKTFFSRITLEDKLTEAYEPYIFAALNSAKVMLVVANKPEQLEARWVKNEWTRYLSMMDKDRNKHILPVFEGMSPYDFPQEIPMVQGQDMAKVGAMQDLIRGICKITGHLYEQNVTAAAVNTGAASMLIRVKQAVEDGVWSEAARLVDEVLNREPENGEAHYYNFLIKHQCRQLPQTVLDDHVPWIEDAAFKRAVQHGSGEQQMELNTFRHACTERRLLSKAESLFKKQEYRNALNTLQELDDLSGKEGYTLRYGQQIEALRKNIKQNLEQTLEAQIIANQKAAWLKAYRDEIGDGKTYISRRIQASHPKEHEIYVEKERKIHVDPELLYEKGCGIIGLIATLLFFVFSASQLNEFNREEGLYLAVGIFGCASLMCNFALMPFGLLVIGSSLIDGFIFAKVLSWVFGDKVPTIFFIVLMILAVLIGIRGLVATYMTIRYKLDYAAWKSYRRTVIAPLEAEIRADVEERWKNKINEKDIIELEYF